MGSGIMKTEHMINFVEIGLIVILLVTAGYRTHQMLSQYLYRKTDIDRVFIKHQIDQDIRGWIFECQKLAQTNTNEEWSYTGCIEELGVDSNQLETKVNLL